MVRIHPAFVAFLVIVLVILALPMPSIPKHVEKCKIFDENQFYYLSCESGGINVRKLSTDEEEFLKAMLPLSKDFITRAEVFKKDNKFLCKIITDEGRALIIPIDFCVDYVNKGKIKIYAEERIFERKIPRGQKSL